MLADLWVKIQELMFLIDLEKINNFIQINKYIYLFIIITYILILYDYRFPKFIKLFWMPLFIIIITVLFTMIDIDDLWGWIKDLFWYTKVLNISFLLHTCWLYWIYIFFWYFRLEKACWIVSRISFLCSLSFVLFLLNYLVLYLRMYFVLNEIFVRKYKFLYYSYFYFIIFIKIIKTIIRFFMMVHGNYNILLMGGKNISYLSYEFLRDMFKAMLFIIVTLILALALSYYLFGICRLYLVWIILFIYEFVKLFKNYLNNYEKIYRDNDIYISWNIFKKYKFLNIWIQFFTVYIILNYTQDIELKNKDYVKFLYTYFYKDLYTYPQVNYLYLNKGNCGFEYSYKDFYYISYGLYLLFFKYEPWLERCKGNFANMFFFELKYDVDKIRKIEEYIKLQGEYYRLTNLEVASYIKFYTIDYRKRFLKRWREYGYTEKQIEKIWIGKNPF